VWEYILSGDAVADALARTEAPVVLVGHSHVALAVMDGPDGLDGGAVSGGAEVDLSAGRWLLNPGSVGQPRDGDPRAAFLVLDPGAGRAVFHRVEYPIARTQAEIRERGLPVLLAERLAHGV
jgi:diadenosine tetraphosphatase ApaH/serine/threonine PP2A family protein phosphatase